MSIIRIFCIPRQSDPGKVTQEFVSLLTVKSKYTLKSIFVIIRIFCIPRHGKVTQEFQVF